jgi:hypothetical protein
MIPFLGEHLPVPPIFFFFFNLVPIKLWFISPGAFGRFFADFEFTYYFFTGHPPPY